MASVGQSAATTPRRRAISFLTGALLKTLALASLALTRLCADAADAQVLDMIDARTEVVFGPNRTVVSLVHDWVFDADNSERLISDIDKADEAAVREALAVKAKETAEWVGTVQYFAIFRVDGVRRRQAVRSCRPTRRRTHSAP